MKIIRLISILLCALLLLSSCSGAQFDTDTLLTPPKMNPSNQKIHNALTKAVGGGYQLVYPGAGDYQDSITSVDLNGDKVAEALCFYTAKNDKTIFFSVLEQKGSEWRVCGKMSGKAEANVHSLSFFDFDKSGARVVAVTWQALKGEEQTLELFTFADSTLVSAHKEAYTNMTALDNTLIGIKRDATGNSVAELIGKKDDTVTVIGSSKLNNSVVNIASIKKSYVGDNNHFILVDEQLDNSQYTTEVLSVNAKNEIANITSDMALATTRNSKIYCYDVDGDGMIDIPVEKQFENRFGDKWEKLYYMEWYGIKDKKAEHIMNAYTSVNEQFLLRLPDAWKGTVSAKKDKASDRQIHFYNTGGLTPLSMFSIRVFSQQEFADEEQSRGWTELYTNNDSVYAFKTSQIKTLASEYVVDKQTLTELFMIMN